MNVNILYLWHSQWNHLVFPYGLKIFHIQNLHAEGSHLLLSPLPSNIFSVIAHCFLNSLSYHVTINLLDQESRLGLLLFLLLFIFL